MRPVAAALLGIALIGLPLAASADPGPASTLPPPLLELPTDDGDEARQAEIERQVLVFLRTLHRHWGKSPETLRQSLDGRLVREEYGKLIYSHPLAEHGVLEGYEFEDGSLVHGLCLFVQQPVNELNEFIEYYGTVKNTLTEAYGAPEEDRMIWEDDLYQPLPEYWGVAVQMGHLRFTASWETPEGTLSVELTGKHHSRLTVDYRHHQSGRQT